MKRNIYKDVKISVRVLDMVICALLFVLAVLVTVHF